MVVGGDLNPDSQEVGSLGPPPDIDDEYSIDDVSQYTASEEWVKNVQHFLCCDSKEAQVHV